MKRIFNLKVSVPAALFVCSLAAFLWTIMPANGSDYEDEHDHVEEAGTVSEDLHDGHDHGAEEAVVHLEPESLEMAGILVSPVSKRTFAETVTLTGTVEPHPDGEALIGSLIEGRVQILYTDIGDEVSVDQPLCTIESPVALEAESAFINAKAELEFIRSDIQRHEALVSEGIGSHKELQALQARLKSAEAVYSAADRTLDAISLVCEDFNSTTDLDCPSGVVMLTSPINGTIVERTARMGAYVEPNENLYHVVDLHRLRIRVEFPERYLNRLSVGASAAISLMHNPHGVVDGKIERIAGKIDSETRTASAFITVNHNHGMLVPNAFVAVEITAADNSTDHLALPIEAIIQDEHGDSAVFVEIGPHEFQLQEVELGRRIDGWVEVISGLEHNQNVVHYGAFALHSESLKGQFGHGHAH